MGHLIPAGEEDAMKEFSRAGGDFDLFSDSLPPGIKSLGELEKRRRPPRDEIEISHPSGFSSRG